MPTLDWIGKRAVLNHHNEVPFRLLRERSELSVGDPASGNLLIEGDNLLALKALLPYYANQVKCVYIDPPYNTGNEKWTYNDNVNSPEIKAWLGQVVGGEAEDLSRHDKWLCMMYPRLVLLRELLSDDGSFWMSIDDNEVEHARVILNDIFGSDNFVATVIWQKVFAPKNSAQYLSEDHDYILVYARNKETWRPNLLPRTSSQDDRYANPDNDRRGVWASDNLVARNPYSKGLYEVTTPSGRVIPGPPTGTWWRFSEENFHRLDEDNQIWWGEDGSNMPRLKRFLSDVKEGLVPQTLWFFRDVGHTQEAKKELLEICEFQSTPDVFVTPKPSRLIRRILQIATGPDDLVLDSFAGTGTTGQAVLAQNTQDGGHRRFMLVEMESAVTTVARQRLQRVIEGYSFTGAKRTELYRKKITVNTLRRADDLFAEMAAIREGREQDFDSFERSIDGNELVLTGIRKIEDSVPGLGGGFRYLQLGETLFDEKGQLREDQISFTDLARHVFFTETGQPAPDDASLDSPLIGTHQGTAVYLLYNGILGDNRPEGGNVLTRASLEALPPHEGPSVIYANSSLLDTAYLRKRRITFKQTPYEIKVS